MKEMEIKDNTELEDRKERVKLLDQYIFSLQRGRADFPPHLFRIAGLGNVYGIVVKEDAEALCIEYPILVSLERNLEDRNRPFVKCRILEMAVFWIQLQKRHVVYRTSGPSVLHKVYQDYLQGFRVSQLGANIPHEAES